MKKPETINEEDRMWEILNVVNSSSKSNLREGNHSYLYPISDERINIVFPRTTKKKNNQSKAAKCS
jgi:hypothetical protein